MIEITNTVFLLSVLGNNMLIFWQRKLSKRCPPAFLILLVELIMQPLRNLFAGRYFQLCCIQAGGGLLLLPLSATVFGFQCPDALLDNKAKQAHYFGTKRVQSAFALKCLFQPAIF